MHLFNFKIHFIVIVFIFLCSCQSELNTCPENLKWDGKAITTLNGKEYSGTCVTKFDNGSIRSIRSYKNGYDHGEWIFYYSNENIQTKGRFNMGKRIGTWQYLFEDGKPWKVQYYDEDGNRIGRWLTYDSTGELIGVDGYSN